MHGQPLALAEALIARPSITPDDAGCQALLAERLAALGFALHSLPQGEVSNLLALRSPDSAGATDSRTPLLLFLGHTDVVPTGPVEAWQSEPFTPSIRDGRLYGRGAADMKGSVAAWVTACERLLESEALGGLRLGILLTSDEEGPANDGIRAIAPTLTYLTGPIEWCLVGEPSSEHTLGDTIRIGRRGSLSGTVTVTGRQGHVAYPALADNSLHRVTTLLAELVAEEWDHGTPAFPPTTLQVTGIDADTDASNVIPGESSARFNLRFSPASTATELQARITDIVNRHAPSARIDWHLSAEPFSSEPGALREAITACVQAQLGLTPRGNTAGGTSDGRFIAPLGAEVVEIGPVNASIHQVDESIGIAELEALSELYEAIIRRLAASPSAQLR